MKRFGVLLVMFIVSMLLTMAIYQKGYESAKAHVLFDCSIDVENNSVLISIDGELYEHLID